MKKECRVFITQIRYEHSTWSGLRDLNPRSLGPKPSAIPNFAKPGWIRFWRRGFGRCGESTGYYIRFAWKMQPPFFGRHGCFTDGAVVFFGRQGCFFQRGEAFAPKSFPLRGRCRRRRRKRCRTEKQYLSTDAEAERRSPLPSSGLRETPDATLPSRGGILRVDLFPFPGEPCRSPSAFRRTELLLKNGKQFLNYRNILLTNDMKSAMVK